MHQRERQIFGIIDGSVIALGVMLVVHPFVHEARHEQGHADDQVPDEAEAANRALFNVREFMDE